MNKLTIDYEDRAVFLIDILGFKNLVEETTRKNGSIDSHKLNVIYESLSRLSSVNISDTSVYPSLKVTNFSDHIVISFQFEDLIELPVPHLDILFDVLSGLEHLLFNLVTKGIICRGGSSLGKIIHTDKIVFGPALIAAYKVECEIAKYPRIVIDKTLIDETVKRMNAKFGNRRTETLSLLEKYITKDQDGLYYIDYFGKIDQAFLGIPLQIRNLRDIIEEGLKSENPCIKAKYSWMRSKFNKRVKLVKEQHKSNPENVPETKENDLIKDLLKEIP